MINNDVQVLAHLCQQGVCGCKSKCTTSDRKGCRPLCKLPKLSLSFADRIMFSAQSTDTESYF